MTRKPFTLAVLCGGPSPERAISLNSARSVCDHLHSPELRVLPIYFDRNRVAYRVSRASLYSNTPGDFDFKLSQLATPLSTVELHATLREADLTFPTMHGRFGEDGEIQALLESGGHPYVGSSASACRQAFDKYDAARRLKAAGFATFPSVLIERRSEEERATLRRFAEANGSEMVVKPAKTGSSLGVAFVRSAEAAWESASQLLDSGMDTRVIIEPVCHGVEFTTLVLENGGGQPVALIPTEVEILSRSGEREYFDFRRKYLATGSVAYHCPPRLADETIARIRRDTARVFELFGMSDFARIDGWVMPDGTVCLTDINPISGMEQNSFLFIQSAELGMSHRDVLLYVVRSACRRNVIQPPAWRPVETHAKRPVHVIFGGATAERQVSLMSGTNVWLKLRQSAEYEPHPYLLEGNSNVWKLPYALCLYHTVEEIAELCRGAEERNARLDPLRREITESLSLDAASCSARAYLPSRMTLAQFVAASHDVFIALHGGIGENGDLQDMLADAGVSFTGSRATASRLCVDKYATGMALALVRSEGVLSAHKRKVSPQEVDPERLWEELASEFGPTGPIVKPIADGCSAGVARLQCAADLARYIQLLREGAPCIPPGVLTDQGRIIEMPAEAPEYILFEEFIRTAKVGIHATGISWHENDSPWIEVTAGQLGPHGRMKCLTPSLTVLESDVLTLEEKFQGGTGVNLTPPPPEYVSPEVLNAAKARFEKVAAVLGLSGFARIDAFLNVRTGEIIVIEANTIPGLTPSTVIFHQALAEPTPLHPLEFLEEILRVRA